MILSYEQQQSPLVGRLKGDPMLIVGELINASRKTIAQMITTQDAAGIQKVAQEQVAAGAGYLDVNAGVFCGKEHEYLPWLVTVVQSAVDVPCCIDSPDPAALEAAIRVHKGVPMINSISLEKERYDRVLPTVADSDRKVVALCMSDGGMPETTDQRLAIADKLITGLVKHNIPLDNIYVDPLVQPVSTNRLFGLAFLEAIEAIVTRFKGVHTMCGLSNISYGLPERKLLNHTFMAMAITRGLDGAIMNPMDRKMMASILAAENLIGRDDYSMRYLKAFRKGLLS